MKLPLKYQVLETLTNACDKNGDFVLSVDKVMAEFFPNMTETDMKSIFADLRDEGFLHYQLSDSVDIVGFQLDKKSRSALITIREELQKKEFEKKDARHWQIKSLAIGYAFGVISTLLVTWLKQVLFGG